MASSSGAPDLYTGTSSFLKTIAPPIANSTPGGFVAGWTETLITATTGGTIEDAQQVLQTKLKNKVLMLDNPPTKPSTVKKHPPPLLAGGHGQKRISARRARAEKTYTLNPKTVKYAAYLSLHTLWDQYYTQLTSATTTPSTLLSRAIKADFHGAIFTVTQTRAPTFLGAQGIVVQETENVFRLVTAADRLLTIPKHGNVFSFTHGTDTYTLYGEQIKYKASERAVRKFKSKATLSL